MLEQINSFAGFNLVALLFALIGGGIFMIIFHYVLMPILSFIILKPFAIMISNTWELFTNAFSRNSVSNDKVIEDDKKNISKIYLVIIYR